MDYMLHAMGALLTDILVQVYTVPEQPEPKTSSESIS
jgi:hypothetical protein